MTFTPQLQAGYMDLQATKRNDWKWLFALQALGLGLRLRGITSALDGDEIFSLRAAMGSWSHTIEVALHDRPHPPLHLILLHLWVQLFGSSSLAVRSLSVLASMVFLVVLGIIARRFASPFVAVTVTAVCAISPYFVYYGQQARPYSLIACIAVLSVWALLRWTEQPKSGLRAFVYAVLCACLVLTQYVGDVFVMAEWLALMLVYGFPIRAVAASVTTVFPSLLWFIAARRVHDSPMDTFIGWIERPRLVDLPSTIIEFCGWPPFAHGGTILLLVMVIALMGILFAVFAIDTLERRILATAAILAVSVPSALFVVSRIAPSSYWAPRQMIGSAAMFCFVIAVGLARCAPLLRSSATATFFICVLLSSWSTSPATMHPPWDRIAKNAVELCRGCRVVAFEPWVANPLSYYLGLPVELVAAVPDANHGIVLVCRDVNCPAENDRGSFRHVAQYDWGQGHTAFNRVELFVAGDTNN